MRCVARCRSAGFADGTSMGSAQPTCSRPSGWRVVMIGTIRESVLAASVAGPAGSVVHAPNSVTGIPSLAIAPVDEQGQQLAPAQDAEDRPQVAPRDDRRATHCSRCRLSRSNSSGNDESSATAFSGRPRWAMAAPMASLLPMWPTVQMMPPFGAVARNRAISSASSGSMSPTTSSCRHERHAHELDEIVPVDPVRAQRQPADTRVVRRQPEDVPEVAVRPAPAWSATAGTTPGRPARSGPRPDEPARSAGPSHGAVGQDDRPLDDPWTGSPSTVRRLQPALAAGHFAATAALAFDAASLR